MSPGYQILAIRQGCRALHQAWQQLVGQIEMMIIAARPAGCRSSRRRHAEHAVIIGAIATGESATIREVMGEHMGWFAGKYVDDESGLLASRE